MNACNVMPWKFKICTKCTWETKWSKRKRRL